MFFVNINQFCECKLVACFHNIFAGILLTKFKRDFSAGVNFRFLWSVCAEIIYDLYLSTVLPKKVDFWLKTSPPVRFDSVSIYEFSSFLELCLRIKCSDNEAHFESYLTCFKNKRNVGSCLSKMKILSW